MRGEELAKTAKAHIYGKSDSGSEVQKRNRGVNGKSASRSIFFVDGERGVMLFFNLGKRWCFNKEVKHVEG